MSGQTAGGFRMVTLYSGSGGNAIYIGKSGHAILVDAGKNAKALCSAIGQIGADMADIRAIFVTHEHSDHISALEVLTKKYDIPVHIMSRSAARFDRLPPSVLHRRLVRHDEMFSVSVDGFTVSSFPTSHDSAMSVGYRIAFADEEEAHTVGIATDLGYVSEQVREGLDGCEAVVLESNHDPEMLENGPYPRDLKRRIRSKKGHLSNGESAQLAAFLAAGGTRGFLLAHLSAENNEPALAFDEAMCAISDPAVSVLVAAPDRPTVLSLSAEGSRLCCR